MNKIKLSCDSTDDTKKRTKQSAQENTNSYEVNTITFKKVGMWDYFDNVQKISVVQFLKILKVLNTSISEFGKKLKK